MKNDIKIIGVGGHHIELSSDRISDMTPKEIQELILVRPNKIKRNPQIEILGQTYEEIPEEKPDLTTRGMARLAVLAAIAGMNEGSSYVKERPKNIIEEYEKILKKESNLSRNDRDWVEAEFKRKFKKV